jgi:hypothetical protein
MRAPRYPLGRLAFSVLARGSARQQQWPLVLRLAG